MCTSVQNLNKLQLIQNGACRTILKVPKETSVDQMHDELALPTLSTRREAHLATECYKSVKNTGSGLNHMFSLMSDNRTRITRLTEGGESIGLPDSHLFEIKESFHIISYHISFSRTGGQLSPASVTPFSVQFQRINAAKHLGYMINCVI